MRFSLSQPFRKECTMFPYKKILVAVDGSPISDLALDEAIKLARETGAELELIHVVDELVYLNGFESATCYIEDVLPLMQAEGEKVLEAGRIKAAAQGVMASSCLKMSGAGRMCDLVAEQAQKSQADLLVLGSHGRRGIRRWLLGSDAEQILRISPVPVLLVRAPAEELKAAAS
ncbi:MAG: universal stress protein [Burkholderiaceae bacterium]